MPVKCLPVIATLEHAREAQHLLLQANSDELTARAGLSVCVLGGSGSSAAHSWEASHMTILNRA